MVRVIETIDELGAALASARPAFVPTMGALHEGHRALVRRARQLAGDQPVVVSIFVNPTQFGPHEDFSRYPRRLEADTRLCAEAGADIVFAPKVEAVYPGKVTQAFFSGPLPAVATQPRLEDAHRPTHFAGVCQVVARLFDLVKPGIAIFGDKDYQQLLVTRAMVAQEQIRGRWPGLRIESHPTVREPDGLSMSSRNAYLDPQARKTALGLFRALERGRSCQAPDAAEKVMKEVLREHNLQIDYAVVRDAQTLMPVAGGDRPLRALIAARAGEVRLIDNAAI